MDSATPLTDSPDSVTTTHQRRSRRRAILLALSTPLILAGCQLPSFGAYGGVSKTGTDTFKLWQGFSVAAVIIGGGTALLMIFVVLRFRARKEDTSLPKQTQYNVPLEILYTILPIIVVIGLFAATVVVENKVVANPTPQATVTAFQWGWKFTYPGHRAYIVGQTTQTPTMVMPADEDVRINLRSADVVHGFYVPKFNFSRFAQPGLLNVFTFNITKPGLYKGQCAQLCGLYHSLMYFDVRVLPLDQYNAWLEQQDAKTSVVSAIAQTGAIASQISPRVPTNRAQSQGAN